MAFSKELQRESIAAAFRAGAHGVLEWHYLGDRILAPAKVPFERPTADDVRYDTPSLATRQPHYLPKPCGYCDRHDTPDPSGNCVGCGAPRT